MTNTFYNVTRKSLITGEPAVSLAGKVDYFFLEILARTHDGSAYSFRYGSGEGENLCAFGTERTFKEAWQEALMATIIGWSTIEMIKTWEDQPKDADPGIEQDSPVYDGPFDPYAGNLDSLFESHAEVEDYGFDYDWER